MTYERAKVSYNTIFDVVGSKICISRDLLANNCQILVPWVDFYCKRYSVQFKWKPVCVPIVLKTDNGNIEQFNYQNTKAYLNGRSVLWVANKSAWKSMSPGPFAMQGVSPSSIIRRSRLSSSPPKWPASAGLTPGTVPTHMIRQGLRERGLFEGVLASLF